MRGVMSYECPRCHRHFTGLTTFDRHQDVNYRREHEPVRCQDPAALGMAQDRYGRWGSADQNTRFPSMRSDSAGTGE